MSHYPSIMRGPKFCVYCRRQPSLKPVSQRSRVYCATCADTPTLCQVARWGKKTCFDRYHEEKGISTEVPFSESDESASTSPVSPSALPASSALPLSSSSRTLIRPIPISPLTPPPPSPPHVEEQTSDNNDDNRATKTRKVAYDIPILPWYMRFRHMSPLPRMDPCFLHFLPIMAQSLMMEMQYMFHYATEVCVIANFRFRYSNEVEPYIYKNICLYLTTLIAYPSLLYQWATSLSDMEEELVRSTISPVLDKTINKVLAFAAKDDLSIDLLLRMKPHEFTPRGTKIEMPMPGYIVAHLTLAEPSSILFRRHYSCCVRAMAPYPEAWNTFLLSLTVADRMWIENIMGSPLSRDV